MNKIQISGLAAVFCLRCVQDTQAGLFKKKSKSSEQTEDSSKKKKKFLFKNLFKSKRSKSMSDITGPHNINMTAEEAAGKMTSLETYVSVLGNWKADKDAVERAQYLIDFIRSLNQGENPSNSPDGVWSKLQSGDPGVWSDDYFRVAVILGERLLRTQGDNLPQNSRQLAHAMQYRLQCSIETHYTSKNKLDMLDDHQKSLNQLPRTNN